VSLLSWARGRFADLSAVICTSWGCPFEHYLLAPSWVCHRSTDRPRFTMRPAHLWPLFATCVSAGLVPGVRDDGNNDGFDARQHPALVTSVLMVPSGGILMGRQVAACGTGCAGGTRQCCGTTSRFCCPTNLSCAGSGCLGPA
jgi:hypothetical protein